MVRDEQGIPAAGEAGEALESVDGGALIGPSPRFATCAIEGFSISPPPPLSMVYNALFDVHGRAGTTRLRAAKLFNVNFSIGPKKKQNKQSFVRLAAALCLFPSSADQLI